MEFSCPSEPGARAGVGSPRGVAHTGGVSGSLLVVTTGDIYFMYSRRLRLKGMLAGDGDEDGGGG